MKTISITFALCLLALSAFGVAGPTYRGNFNGQATITNSSETGPFTFYPTLSDTNFIVTMSGGGTFIFSNAVTGATFKILPNGVASGDGSGLTNLTGISGGGTNSAGPVVFKYVVTNQPANGDTNAFGPWTVGTQTAGIQEAINALPLSAFPNVPGGGWIVFGPGTFITSTNVHTPNTTNSFSITLQGQGMEATRVLGNFTNAMEVFTFGMQHSGSALEPFVNDMSVFSTFNATTNVINFNGANNNSFVGYGGIERGGLMRVAVGYWNQITNQFYSGFATRTNAGDTAKHDLIGVNIDCNYNNMIRVQGCEFVYCLGLSWASDHGVIEDNTFGSCGCNTAQPTNDWPKSSPYYVGSCITVRQATGGNTVFNGNEHWVIRGNDFILSGPGYFYGEGFKFPHKSSDDYWEGGTVMANVVEGYNWTFINPKVPQVMSSFVITNTTDYSLPFRAYSATNVMIVDLATGSNSGPWRVAGTITSDTGFTGNGAGVTNLPPTSIISNGTYLVNGILATNSGATSGAFLTETGTNRAYSYNAGSFTNLNASNLTGSILATNLLNYAGTTNSATLPSLLAMDSTGTNVWSFANPIRTYSTNVTFVAQTSLLINFSPAYADTNYTVSAPNGLVGEAVSARTTSSFTVGFTSATLTGVILEGVLMHR